jgi:hypothetical protein
MTINIMISNITDTPELIVISVIIIAYLIRWEWDHTKVYTVIGTALITVAQTVFFATYIYTVGPIQEHISLLVICTITLPVFDLIRSMYPDVGVIASTLSMAMFALADDTPPTYATIGCVLSFLPMFVAIRHIRDGQFRQL